MTNNTNAATFASLFALYVVANKAHTGKVYHNAFLVRLDEAGQPATNDKGFLLMSEVDAQTVAGLAATDLGMVPTEHNASRKSRTRWIAMAIKGQDADQTSAPGVLNANCLEYVAGLDQNERADLVSALEELRGEYEGDYNTRAVRRLYLDARDYLGKVRQYAPRAVSHEQATDRHATDDTAHKAHDNLMPWIVALHDHLTGAQTPTDAQDTDDTTQDTDEAPSVAHAASEKPSTRDRLKSALQKKAPEYVPGSFLARMAELDQTRETEADDPSILDMRDLDDLFSQI